MFSPCSEKQKTGSDYTPAASLNVRVQTAEDYSEFFSWTRGKMAYCVCSLSHQDLPSKFHEREKLAER